MIKVSAVGTLWAALAEDLQLEADITTPRRRLLIGDDGAPQQSYVPPAGWSLIDIAAHPSGQVSAVLAGDKALRLVRLDRQAHVLGDMLFADPGVANDPFDGEPSPLLDSTSMLPWTTHDTVRIAAAGEDAVLALHTGRLAVLAYRFGFTAATGFRQQWRTLVEPGADILAVAIIGPVIDPFLSQENQWHVVLDVAADGRVAVAINTIRSGTLAAHAKLFHDVATDSNGVLVTELAPDGQRIRSRLVPVPQPSDVHALRWIGSTITVVGRTRTEQRADGTGWDGFLARFPASAAPSLSLIDVRDGDVLFDVAGLADGQLLVAGASAYNQNPSGASISENTAPLLLVLGADGQVLRKLDVALGPRQNLVRSLAAWRGHWLIAGYRNGPGTHSADLSADGYLHEVSP